MMHWSLADIERATWWQYQALLWNWNDRHTNEAEEPAEAPDADFVARRQQRLADSGLARTVH